MVPLSRTFFEQPTLHVAKKLLGHYLVRYWRGKNLVGRIVETEAYAGEDDLASHASRGRTPRTEIMYGPCGRAYIYMIYGMYYCLNIVTEAPEFPAAVLIRSVELIDPSARSKKERIDGPGRVCKTLHITRALNGIDVTSNQTRSYPNPLWIARGRSLSDKVIRTGRRIGVDYAKHCASYPWRFILPAAAH